MCFAGLICIELQYNNNSDAQKLLWYCQLISGDNKIKLREIILKYLEERVRKYKTDFKHEVYYRTILVLGSIKRNLEACFNGIFNLQITNI